MIKVTDKERLEKVRENAHTYKIYEYITELPYEDYLWLVGQAKRAIKNAEDLQDMDMQLASEQREIKRLKSENERLKVHISLNA